MKIAKYKKGVITCK